jgi:hypothetical protein
MRGRPAKIGDETINQNGYTYVKVEHSWRPKAHIIAEKKLGRPLHDDERVRFVDSNRDNFDPDNIEVYDKSKKGIVAQLTRVNQQIAELQGRKVYLEAQLALDE